ncbi:ATP-dependent Clp protease ATP-binding subunit [Candidatus Microgenomates bacterium]|nr:ATP-dependent Clp protease ATP-binding subunit [Candidatus Microgenomates bacterium]
MDTILMFQFAKLYNFYRHPAVVTLQVVILLLVGGSLFYAVFQGTSLLFSLGLTLLFLMVEVFMRVKVASLRPAKEAKEAGDKEIYQTFTLHAAASLLKAGDASAFVNDLINAKEVQFVLKRAQIAKKEIKSTAVDGEKLAVLAFSIAREEEKAYVTLLDIFAAYLLLTESKTKLLLEKELVKEDLLTLSAFAQTVFPKELVISLPKLHPQGPGIGEGLVSGWTLQTQKYTLDFTKKTLLSSPISVGREKELSAVMEILSKSKQSNVLLVGEPGVGKKEIVAAFAKASFVGNTSKELRYQRVLELLSGTLVAGAGSSGELEQRLSDILTEVTHAGDVILFIPELQNIAGAGSDSLDVTGVLLPHLLEDKLRIIATITPENHQAFFERKASFTDAFEKILVEEPSLEEAVPMLLDASLLLEETHRIIFTYKAVVETGQLSHKYLQDKFLPGSAIALLDEAGAKVRLLKKKVVEEADIVGIIEEKTEVKVALPKNQEKELLLHLEDVIHKRMVDQDEAVKTVSEALRRLRSGLAFEGRPSGVFLFLGPTGVGKTELAKALSEIYFNSEENMIRFDMSEYQESSSTSRLISELTEKVRTKPFSLILLDEFEKAYPSILDIFLSIFEDGRLTDLSGRTVSFVSTIIIATSNAGGEEIREAVGQGVALEALKSSLVNELLQNGVFKPELINRFDAVVLFKPLGEKEIEQVTALLLAKVAELLKNKDISFSFDDKAVSKIAREGFDQTMGARPLRRFIQDHVEDMLSQKLLRDEIKRGDTAVLSTDNADNLTLNIKK